MGSRTPVGSQKTRISLFFLKHIVRFRKKVSWSKRFRVFTRVDHFKSKGHFLQYAGRYVRRPPIAQRRFVRITNEEVVFWTKDLREKRIVETRYSVVEFLRILAEHVPQRYQHAMRYFGLLAPRAKGRTSAAIFLLLGQKRRPRPRRWGWAFSLRMHFGVDPLRDSSGRSMHWIGRPEPDRI
jgi:Putative transposase